MTTDADLLIETSDGVADAFRAEGFRVVESADPDDARSSLEEIVDR